MMFESLFGELPVGVRKIMEKRLEGLVLNISEENVPDIRALVTLAQHMRREIKQLQK